ncbi:MAG TPA: hypothetical protein VF544_05960 [Pyrinomonadaceae bacterium]|jgi:hypothetical protein
MAVIINEFEVVSEPPPSDERGGGGAGDEAEGQAGQAQGPTPHQVEQIIEHQQERRARVWAH